MNNSGTAVGSNHFGIRRIAKFFAQTRCLPLILITAACLFVREQFPFSNFPMYSSFGSHTFYVYLADAAGSPIPAIASTGVSTPTLKKMYVTEMRKEAEHLQRSNRKLTTAEKTVVGERLLQRLAVTAQKATPSRGLSLYEVTVDLRHGRFDKQTTRIAAIQ